MLQDSWPLAGSKIDLPLDSQPDLDGSFVGRISQSLYPRDPCGRLFVILTAYYDESGTYDGSPATVLAGFVGDTNQMVELEIEWAKILKKHGLTHVRAKHLFHRQKQFKGWSDDRAGELWADLLYVLQERKEIHASKSVLRDEDYRLFYVSDGAAPKERLDTKYALCLRSLLSFLPAVRTGAMEVNFVLESGHKNAGDALRVFNEMKNDKNFRYRHSIGSISFGSKQESPALQAADMLAYSSYQDEREAAENGVSLYLSRDSLDVELIWGCGLTLLQHRIQPKDLMTIRKNYLRKNKQQVFGRAVIDYTMEIEPSSHYAQNARLRVPPGN
jgi:hypothetical protein